MNLTAARLARKAADAVGNETGKRRFVAGAIGPLPVTASLSPEVNDPAFRSVSFDQLRQAYREQVEALLDGGVDLAEYMESIAGIVYGYIPSINTIEQTVKDTYRDVHDWVFCPPKTPDPRDW